jgi:hypothetical protein
MSKKVISDLKKEIANKERELNALVEAANLILSASSGRGRKASVTTNLDAILKNLGKEPKAGKKKGTGKRGRPKGSKNKPGAKKPGPKPAAKSATKSAEKKATKKAGKRGPGRPPKSASAAKPAVKKAAGKKPAAKKAGKRGRPAKSPKIVTKSTGGPVIIPASAPAGE